MAHPIELDSENREVIASAVRVRRHDLLRALERRAAIVLVVLAVLGFGLRLSGVSQVGLAEDEINKLDAVRAYERGDITPNAEHPMLMKAFIYASVEAAQAWNASAAAAAEISDEAALRFPNILFGALTVFPLFLLTAAFFDRRTGLLAAALWAFGINAITYNRIAKEDTLLVFFMLFAFYFYLRAKQTSGHERAAKRRSYILSAVSFGLMFASKYFPHYFGLNMLYHHVVRVREGAPDEPRGNTPLIFYVVVFVAFLVANPALLLPQTWDYLSIYSSEQLLTHHGYLMGERLYDNTMSSTPFGTPVYFYLLFLLIKTPLSLLLALVVGLAEVVRRRKEPGHAFLLMMFVLWVVPFSIVGSKWLRYTLSLMPLVYIIGAVGIIALVRRCASALERRGVNSAAQVVGTAAVLVFVAVPALMAYAKRPHYALYTNALAAARAGYFFPHDEFYDDGLREAIQFVCRHAPQGATLAHETPGVVRHYLEQCGRKDLRSRIISDPQLNILEDPKPEYVILQRGRVYFENREEVNAVRLSAGEPFVTVPARGASKTSGSLPAGAFVKVYEGIIDGLSAVEVYRSAATVPE